MTKISPAAALVAVFLFAFSSPCQNMAPSSAVTVIEGATVIDGVSGRPIQDAALVIKGTTIQSIDPRAKVHVPDNAKRIDASGKTIRPRTVCRSLKQGYLLRLPIPLAEFVL